MWRATAIAVVSIVTISLLGGCGAPILDLSSNEAGAKSLDRLGAAMSVSERAEFISAISSVYMSELFRSALKIDGFSTEQPLKSAAKRLHGGTVAAILEEGEKARAELDRLQEEISIREEEQILTSKLEEIRSINGEITKFREIQNELAKVEVLKSQFNKRRELDLAVKNGLSRTIATLLITKKIVSPGRSVPWSEEKSRFDVPGGLMPDETKEWQLNSYFTSLGSAPPESELICVATISGVIFDDGSEIELSELPDDMLKRLEALMSTVPSEPEPEPEPEPAK